MAATKAAARAANLKKLEKLAEVFDGMAPGTGKALHDLLSDLATAPAATKAAKK